MTVRSDQPPLAEYLRRLERGLWGVSGVRRREILQSVREHLSEDLGSNPADGEDGLRWLLQAHGRPERMARSFTILAWVDGALELAGLLAPVAAGLLWMAFMGLLMGLGRETPGYLRFLSDFPALLLVIGVVRRVRARATAGQDRAWSMATGFASGLLFCLFLCGGKASVGVEHGLYGAFLGLALERNLARDAWRLRLLDTGGFLAILQLAGLARSGALTWMGPGPLTYHLLNGLGVHLLLWVFFIVFKSLRQSIEGLVLDR